MSITRAARPQANFYLLDKQISEDKRLSWAARGMLVYLLGKPDHWTVSPAALIAETQGSAKPSGRDSVYSILNELVISGYVRRVQSNGCNGRFDTVDYIVSETPTPHTDLPDTVEPYTDEPHTANPLLVSTDVLVSTEKATRNDKSAGRVLVPKPEDVREETWRDFLLSRKGHKAPVTKTALEAIRREAEKAKMPLDSVLQEICARGWRGFKADWMARTPARPETWYEKNDRVMAELTGRNRNDRDDGPFIDV